MINLPWLNQRNHALFVAIRITCPSVICCSFNTSRSRWGLSSMNLLRLENRRLNLLNRLLIILSRALLVLILDSRNLANYLLKVSNSSIERCLCLSKLSILIRWNCSLCSVLLTINTSLEWLHCDLSNHYLISFVFDYLIWIAANNWWRDNKSGMIYKSDDLTEWVYLQCIWKGVKHFLDTHVLRN